ncbi:MAG: HalOD1 output domain-containing protein [Halorubrum sp.]
MSRRSTTRRYDWSEVSPGVAVVETVADLEAADVEALPALAHSVDVDALNDLLRGAATGGSEGAIVSFRYHGYDVTITSSGTLEVER